MVRHDAPHRCGIDRRGRRIAGQKGDAEPRLHRAEQNREVIRLQLAADASDDLIGVRRAYMPDVVALNRAVNQALMPAQLVGVRGRAMRREICIRGDHDPGIDAEVAAAEDAVGELAQPY